MTAWGGLYTLNERFGVAFYFSATGKAISDYDYQSLGPIGWYVDGESDYAGYAGITVGPGGNTIERITVVAGAGSPGPPGLGSAQAIVDAHPDWYPPGSAWMIGNELGNDSFGSGSPQGGPAGLLAHEYARVFHEWQVQIKQIDPTYRVMLGTIAPNSQGSSSWNTVRYLRKLFFAYHNLYGEPMPVDVFNLRLYLKGQTLSLEAFKSAVGQIRSWMAEPNLPFDSSLSYRNTELWLTGYGPADSDVNSELALNMMTKWTDWLGGYADTDIFDEQTGMGQDDWRLVQRWAWFPLDDPNERFAETRLFFDENTLGLVGMQYADYLARTIPEPSVILTLLTGSIFLLNLRAGSRRQALRRYSTDKATDTATALA